MSDHLHDQGAAARLPDFALLWDARIKAIIAGADKLEAVVDENRITATDALRAHANAHARSLADEGLLASAVFMVDDLCKSYFNEFRWTDGVHDYIAATAGAVLEELSRRDFVLHYAFDTTHVDAYLDETLTYLPAPFAAAGFVVAGPQLMALSLMEADVQQCDVTHIPRYLHDGLNVADMLVQRCHHERRPSVYLNIDRNDDTEGLPLDVALSQRGAPRTVVVFRSQPALPGSTVEVWPPPGMTLPGPTSG
ncbi:MAG: hypothetical protein HYZ39_04775 [Mycolicibacterium cosmeticum]|nr:hypothetical protein [Mycolicibacterium cosmeticum]